MQIHHTLKRHFGFDDFREGQAEVIGAIVGGKFAAAIFPTGSGKSLCYQLPAEERARSDWMREAYRQHGYTMQGIATFAGLHHSTVSRLIKIADGDKKMRETSPFSAVRSWHKQTPYGLKAPFSPSKKGF